MSTNSHEKKFFFFVNDVKYDTDQETVTGAYIKSRVPDLPPGTGLELEGHGSDPNSFIKDDEVVSLALGHGEGAKHFHTSPPANFG